VIYQNALIDGKNLLFIFSSSSTIYKYMHISYQGTHSKGKSSVQLTSL